MEEETRDIVRQEIIHEVNSAVHHLVLLHVGLRSVGLSEADDWIPHMISALNTIAEYYKQDIWE